MCGVQHCLVYMYNVHLVQGPNKPVDMQFTCSSHQSSIYECITRIVYPDIHVSENIA